MSVVFSSRAAREFENQLEYLLEAGAAVPAHQLRQRVLAFVDEFLAAYPKAGHFIAERNIYEIWIPRTKLVLFYRIEEGGVIRVLALFHTSSNRSEFGSSGAEG